MSRRRKALIALAATVFVGLALVALRVAPLITGPAVPAGAERLHITTAAPNLNMGCATALLSPVRVTSEGEELVLASVESGETIRVVWPAGFGAWRVDGQAVVADPWGSIVGREGDVLDWFGGGYGMDDVFHICPFGIVTER